MVSRCRKLETGKGLEKKIKETKPEERGLDFSSLLFYREKSKLVS